MCRFRRLDEWARNIGVAQFKGDRNDLNAEGCEFFAQCLPTWQVVATASIGRPGYDNNFLTPQRRQVEVISVEIWKDDVWGLSGYERSSAERLRAQGRQA